MGSLMGMRAAIFAIAAALGALLTIAQHAGSPPLTESDDPHTFLAAASAFLDESPRGAIALVLIDDGEVVGEHYASIGESVGPDTLFQVASLSKWITAWGVMALVEEGRIDLDAPVSIYLTRWSLPESGFDNDGVTVRRLLSHSAGLTDGFGYLGFERAADVQTLEESLTRTADGAFNVLLPSAFQSGVRVGVEPGAQFHYSGGGYTILQLLIEEVSGRSFNDYMCERVLEPLGMSGSTFVLDEAGEARRADFYASDGSIAPPYRYTALAATSLYTSTEDLTRFLLAHFPGSEGEPPGRGVLRPETLEAMREPQIVVEPPAAWWGLGMMLTPGAEDGWAMSHSGANRPAFATFAQVDPASGDGIIMLSSGEPDGMRVVQEWWAWVAAAAR